MKHKGCNFPYAEQRKRELLRAFRIALESSKRVVMDDIFKMVVAYPCTRFWVTEERAFNVVKAMMKGLMPCPKGEKREMYEEIFSRVKLLKETHPEVSVYLLTQLAVNSPAPRFYLSPSQAKAIINGTRYPK